MLGQHHRLSDPDRERFAGILAAWRARSLAEQWLHLGSNDVTFAPGVEPARGRIRLGLFCPCLGLGGAESWQLGLIRALDPEAVVWRGAAVTDGRRGVVPAMLDQLEAAMPVGFGLDAARTLAASVDVVISWSVIDHDALIRDLPRPPRVVLACHFPGELAWSRAEEALLGRADRLVAVSELALDSLPRCLRGRAEVIWNAVDGGRLATRTGRAATRGAWGVPADAPVAGFLGRFAPEKEPEAMLRLAAHLPEPWHVVLVGEGRLAPELADRVTRLGLDRVRLVPGTGEVGDILAAFDTLVVPSRFESFGLTMAEGFAAGVPVVGTPVGLLKLVPGLARVVPPGLAGADLAAAVRADRLDPVGTATRVERARLFARDRLGLERFGREWLRLIRDVAASGPAWVEEGAA